MRTGEKDEDATRIYSRAFRIVLTFFFCPPSSDSALKNHRKRQIGKTESRNTFKCGKLDGRLEPFLSLKINACRNDNVL